MAIRLSENEFEGLGCIFFILSLMFIIIGIYLFFTADFGEKDILSPWHFIIGGILGALVFKRFFKL